MKDVVVLVGDPKFVRCQPFYSQSAIESSVEGDVCVCAPAYPHTKNYSKRRRNGLGEEALTNSPLDPKSEIFIEALA